MTPSFLDFLIPLPHLGQYHLPEKIRINTSSIVTLKHSL